MRSIRARYPSSTSLRRSSSRSTPDYLRSPNSRTPGEHAAIAAASSKWETEVIRGLRAFISKVIPLNTGNESLRITHVLGIAEDETLTGWYNWRGVTNPDIVLLGTLVGGPQNGANAAAAVDAKLSARSGKLQVLTDTLAQLLEPFQPLTNHVDSLLGSGASQRLALRDGFHVIRGVATTIDTAGKSTRSLRDPEFAAAWEAAKPAPVPVSHPRPAPRTRLAPAPQPARAAAHPAFVPAPKPVVTAAAPRTRDETYAALFRETVWALDRLVTTHTAMPEPSGTYMLMDVLALDGYTDAPADLVLLGLQGDMVVAQAVVLGGRAPLPTDRQIADTLAALPGGMGSTRVRIVPAFRVVPGQTDTLPVLGNRRTLALMA